MNENGSAFLETIIATAILAGLLGAAFETLQGAADRARKAALKEQAMLVAQSRLALFPLNRAVRPDRLSGAAGGFAWRIEIAPDRSTTDGNGLMRVDVEVVAQSDPATTIHLRSLRQGAGA